MIGALLPWLKWWPLAASLAAFAAGWAVSGWEHKAAEKAAVEAALKARIEMEKSGNDKSAELETKLAELDKQNRALSKRISHETRKDAYRCPVPADGVQLLNSIRAGTSEAPRQPDR